MKANKIKFISVIALILSLFTSNLSAEIYSYRNYNEPRKWRGLGWDRAVNPNTELRLNNIIDSVNITNRENFIKQTLVKVYNLELSIQNNETNANLKVRKLAYLWEIRDILEWRLYNLSNTSTTYYPNFTYNISLTQSSISSINAIINTNQPGKWYYVILSNNQTSPTSSQIKSWVDSYWNNTLYKWVINLTAWNNQLNITWLTQNTGYILYFVAEDAYNTLNANILNLPFQTTTNNIWTTNSTQNINISINSISNTAINWTISTNTAGRWYYVILPNSTNIPNSKQIRDWTDNYWNNTLYKWVLNLNVWANQFSVTWLNSNTSYKMYLIEDNYSWSLTSDTLTLIFNTTLSTTNTLNTTNSFSINISSQQVSTTSLSIIVNTTQSGKGYYIILPNTTIAPTASQIKSWIDSYWNFALAKWNMNLLAWNNQLNITWLGQNINYILYYSYEDNTGNLNSNILNLPFKTLPDSTSIWQNITIKLNPSSLAIDCIINTNVSGRWYYVILPDWSPTPSSGQIKAWLDSNSRDVSNKWNIYLYAWNNKLNITWLNTGTRYILYFTAIDYNRNLLPNPISIPFVTL